MPSSLAAAAARKGVPSSISNGDSRNASVKTSTLQKSSSVHKEAAKKSSLQEKASTNARHEIKNPDDNQQVVKNDDIDRKKMQGGKLPVRASASRKDNDDVKKKQTKAKGTGSDFPNKNKQQRPGQGKDSSHQPNREATTFQFEISLDNSSGDDDGDPQVDGRSRTSKFRNEPTQPRTKGSRNSANGKVIDVSATNRLIGHALGKRIPTKQQQQRQQQQKKPPRTTRRKNTNDRNATRNIQKNNRHPNETNRQGRFKDLGDERLHTDRRDANVEYINRQKSKQLHSNQRQIDGASPNNNNNRETKPEAQSPSKPLPRLISSEENEGGYVERVVQVTNWADDESEGDY